MLKSQLSGVPWPGNSWSFAGGRQNFLKLGSTSAGLRPAATSLPLICSLLTSSTLILLFIPVGRESTGAAEEEILTQ